MEKEADEEPYRRRRPSEAGMTQFFSKLNGQSIARGQRGAPPQAQYRTISML